jgi:hypothetical protein
MNSKVWIRKALSMCLAVAILATYSMVALAGTEKVAGELLVSGKNINGETPFVMVNGEAAQSGRSIFSSSTIATPANASAVINLGKVGKIELAPNTTMTLSFSEKGITGDLVSGRVTVLSATDSVNIKTAEGKVLQLGVGESAVSKAADDDDTDNKGGMGWWVWALVFGGAIAGVVIAATTDNNRVALGGGSTVVSPTR